MWIHLKLKMSLKITLQELFRAVWTQFIDMTHDHFPPCLRNTTQTSAPRALSCLAVRSSVSPSPGRSSATPRSCCWTRPRPPWTRRARRYASLPSDQRPPPRVESTHTSHHGAAARYSSERGGSAVNYYYHQHHYHPSSLLLSAAVHSS